MSVLQTRIQTCKSAPKWICRWLSTKMSRKRPKEDLGIKETKMQAKYFNFAHQPATAIPQSLHTELSWALSTLRRCGYFYRDWVKVKGQTVQTPISRTLVGVPGTTYKYLGLRLFAVPWSTDDEENQPASEVELACLSFGKLNDHLKRTSRKLLSQKMSRDQGELATAGSSEPTDGTAFNVSLINYMDPSDLEQRLKPEPYYGMGPLAVSWHMDSNLVRGSTVAVYSHTCPDDVSTMDEDDIISWRVGLKVSWDIETQGVAVPLGSGETYMMLADLNDTHQHCVIAGSQPRFSSTHRVADCSKGTLDYIRQRCKRALDNLHYQQDDPAKSFLKSLDPSCVMFTETVHNEVEFEWLRQFWMQGARHARERNWWIAAMEDLEKDWNKLELMTKLAINQLDHCMTTADIASVLVPLIEDRCKMRKQCLKKFSPHLYDTLPADFTPIHRPLWEDDDLSRPLPFNLKPIVRKIRTVWRENRTKDDRDSQSSNSSKDSDDG